MKSSYWVLIIILGIAMSYIPQININIPSVSLGAIVLVIGVFGLAKNLFK